FAFDRATGLNTAFAAALAAIATVTAIAAAIVIVAAAVSAVATALSHALFAAGFALFFTALGGRVDLGAALGERVGVEFLLEVDREEAEHVLVQAEVTLDLVNDVAL